MPAQAATGGVTNPQLLDGEGIVQSALLQIFDERRSTLIDFAGATADAVANAAVVVPVAMV